MSIDRISTQRYTVAMVAVDNFELITARVRKLLSWGRRMSMTQRYTYTDSPPDLHVGLVLDLEARPTGISESRKEDGCHFGVNLKPGIPGFGFSAYTSDGNGTEAEAWKRFHAGKDSADPFTKRRNMTEVTLIGGLDGDFGPSRDDLLVIRAWNEHGVCDEKVIGFDTPAYWAEREAERAAAEAEVAR